MYGIISRTCACAVKTVFIPARVHVSDDRAPIPDADWPALVLPVKYAR